MARRGYIFTNKAESKKGILSTFLGALSLAGLAAAIYLTFIHQGEAFVKYGVAGVLCLFFSAAGLALGILARLEEDKFYFFAWMGILLNALALAGIVFILYAGVHGL